MSSKAIESAEMIVRNVEFKFSEDSKQNNQVTLHIFLLFFSLK